MPLQTYIGEVLMTCWHRQVYLPQVVWLLTNDVGVGMRVIFRFGLLIQMVVDVLVDLM